MFLTKAKISPVVFSQKQQKVVEGRKIHFPDVVGKIKTLSFDQDGSLLASGATDGGLCFYKFRSFFFRASKKYNEANRLFYSQQHNSTPNSTKDEVENEDNPYTSNCIFMKKRSQPPIARVQTHGKSINSLAWCPNNPNTLSCTFACMNTIQIFDINRLDKKIILHMNSTGGHTSIAFGQTSNLIYAGTTSGCINFWDLRARKTPQWTLSERISSVDGSRILTNASLSIYFSSNQSNIIAGSTSGHVINWDIRKDL